MKELKIDETGKVTLEERIVEVIPLGPPKHIRVNDTVVGYSWSRQKIIDHVKRNSPENADSYCLSVGSFSEDELKDMGGTGAVISIQYYQIK